MAKKHDIRNATGLAPKTVMQRCGKMFKQLEELKKRIQETQARCTHHKHISFSAAIYDSGWDCSACGASWRKQPDGVEV